PTPVISCAPLISAALTSDGLGFTPALLFFQNCVKSAAAPAICGAECDVPVLQRCTESILPNSASVPERPPVTAVPGAVMSGLMRPSAAGPRLEELLRSSMLSAKDERSVRLS